MPLIPCLPTPFSFLFKTPGIAKWHVLNTQHSQLKIPEHVLICIGASSLGALQTLSHLSLKTPCEVGCGQWTLFQKGKEGFERKGHHLRFYSEAQSLTSQLKIPITVYFPPWNRGSPFKANVYPRILAHRERPGLDGFGTPATATSDCLYFHHITKHWWALTHLQIPLQIPSWFTSSAAMVVTLTI